VQFFHFSTLQYLKNKIQILYWDRLFGQKRPLLIFSGTLSGKTKQIEEKNNDRNSRLFNINEPRKIKLMFI